MNKSKKLIQERQRTKKIKKMPQSVEKVIVYQQVMLV